MQIPEFKLERHFARYEFRTRFVMCASDAETWTTREILQLEPGSEGRYLDLRLGYVPSEGSPELRSAVADLYQSIDSDQVLMFAGAEEGIFCFIHAELNPGDHIIVHAPCFQSHKEIAAAVGAEVTLWEARARDSWRLDPGDLARMIRPNTKVLLLNYPHNPSGAMLDRDSFAAIVEICECHGVRLFSDEVFRESELDASARLPAACDVMSTAVSLGVLSKSYGLPGLRIGWAATRDRGLLARLAAVKDYTTICNSGPSEFLAEIALRHREKLVARTVALLRGNLARLDPFFSRHADLFEWVRPAASPMAFPRLLRGRVDEFCDAAVREAGVYLLPGSVYDHSGNHFRIGFGRQNFPEALAELELWLERVGWPERSEANLAPA
jgi:aspartate/methionine/tyrosine aminotransferase